MTHVNTKAIIFDLDGVLLESRDMHWCALNDALAVVSSDHVISYELHEKRFNGLPTRIKLNILTSEFGLDSRLHAEIVKLKQLYTITWIEKYVKPDEKLQSILSCLRQRGIKTAIASNSVKATVDAFTKAACIERLLDVSLSNEDVVSPKPSGEIYELVLRRLGVTTKEVLAVEDSHVGCKSALMAGIDVLHVSSPLQLTEEIIYSAIDMSTGNATVIMPNVSFSNAVPKGIICGQHTPLHTCVMLTNVNVDKMTIIEELNANHRSYLTTSLTPNAYYVVGGCTAGTIKK